jgi:hypothetical protein
MNISMATGAENDEILFCIVSEETARTLMAHL